MNPSITVPQGVWKVVISEDHQDKNSNLPYFARFGVYIGNDLRKGSQWGSYTSSIGQLEGYLNSTYRNSPDLNPQYNFFNHLPTKTANDLKFGSIVLPRASLLSEFNFSEPGIAEGGTSQVAVFKGALEQIGLLPDSIAKVTANKVASVTIVNSSEVGTTEVNIFPYSNIPHSVSKISFSQNRATEVNSQVRSLQINTAKVNTSEQTFNPVIDSNIAKISLPIGISNQQFFNSNVSQFPLIIHTCEILKMVQMGLRLIALTPQ